LKGQQLEDVADFVASFAGIPADQTPDEWLSDPAVAKHPGSEPFQKECGQCHQIEGYTEGGTRDAPGLFAWGSPQWTSRMIRKPGAPDLYGFLEEKDRMPPFGADQLTANDTDMVIRYLNHRYPMPSGTTSAAVARNPEAVTGHVSARQP
jgi:ubiquinol-cytochrome c reductase cytochrome b subunit